MEWFPNKIWATFIILLATLAVLSVSDEHSDEKLHCTDDSCDSGDAVKFESGTDEERESDGVYLDYSCASPNFVPEEDVPVIFLHGMSDSKLTWNGIYQNIPILTHRKACIYDARNHGDSSWNDTLNVDVLAEDLGHLMDKLNIERAVLVGHSMGGLTAMKFALTNPSKVDRLLLEDISPVPLPKQVVNFINVMFNTLQKSVGMVPKGADENTALKIITEYLREVTHQQRPEKILSERKLLHQRDGVWQWKANFDAFQKAMADPDKNFSIKPAGHYTEKTLFVYGKLSPFGVENDKKEILKYFPKAEFVGVEGADHDIHPTHREFQTELIKFLE